MWSKRDYEFQATKIYYLENLLDRYESVNAYEMKNMNSNVRKVLEEVEVLTINLIQSNLVNLEIKDIDSVFDRLRTVGKDLYDKSIRLEMKNICNRDNAELNNIVKNHIKLTRDELLKLFLIRNLDKISGRIGRALNEEYEKITSNNLIRLKDRFKNIPTEYRDLENESIEDIPSSIIRELENLNNNEIKIDNKKYNETVNNSRVTKEEILKAESYVTRFLEECKNNLNYWNHPDTEEDIKRVARVEHEKLINRNIDIQEFVMNAYLLRGEILCFEDLIVNLEKRYPAALEFWTSNYIECMRRIYDRITFKK